MLDFATMSALLPLHVQVYQALQAARCLRLLGGQTCPTTISTRVRLFFTSAAWVLQVFKHYMKSDASDYGEGASLMRTTSRKRAQRTDSMQEAAVQANGGVDDPSGLESRSTDAGTPFLPDGVSPGNAYA